MHLFCFCKSDSKNGFAEKVRWGKKFKLCVGLSVGKFHFQSVHILLSCGEIIMKLSFLTACC